MITWARPVVVAFVLDDVTVERVVVVVAREVVGESGFALKVSVVTSVLAESSVAPATFEAEGAAALTSDVGCVVGWATLFPP